MFSVCDMHGGYPVKSSQAKPSRKNGRCFFFFLSSLFRKVLRNFSTTAGPFLSLEKLFYILRRRTSPPPSPPPSLIGRGGQKVQEKKTVRSSMCPMSVALALQT